MNTKSAHEGITSRPRIYLIERNNLLLSINDSVNALQKSSSIVSVLLCRRHRTFDISYFWKKKTYLARGCPSKGEEGYKTGETCQCHEKEEASWSKLCFATHLLVRLFLSPPTMQICKRNIVVAQQPRTNSDFISSWAGNWQERGKFAMVYVSFLIEKSSIEG